MILVQRSDCYGCVRLHDALLCYALLPPLDPAMLETLMRRGYTLIPTRLAAGVLHALQAYRLARRAAEGGWSRARRTPLEAILYLLAAHGYDPTRLNLSRAAEQGPKPGEPLLAVCEGLDECRRLVEERGCGDPRWAGIEEKRALALTALAAAEVERKRRIREETA